MLNIVIVSPMNTEIGCLKAQFGSLFQSFFMLEQ